MQVPKITYFNPHILEKLASMKPNKAVIARQKYKNFNMWLEGKNYPTYNQLVELSKLFNVPFGYFFLDELPEYLFPIPHYRTNQNGVFTPSEELKDTLEYAEDIQKWAKDILIELGNDKLSFCGKLKNEYKVDEVVDELKNIFEIRDGWAESMNSWRDAFRYLVTKAEEKGIIVLVNGVVWNNTHRKLDVEEFRGFVLYDEIAPVIFINNNDYISGKIFTLIHEVVHIIIGKSASFDLKDLQSAQNEIEKFCDKCTAEFLVPTQELKKVYKGIKNYEELAKKFKVSQIVIARRLLDLELISKNEFYNFLQDSKRKEIKQYNRGGNFYEMEIQRLSRRFLRILSSAIYNNLITYLDAIRFTKLKRDTFSKLVRYST